MRLSFISSPGVFLLVYSLDFFSFHGIYNFVLLDFWEHVIREDTMSCKTQDFLYTARDILNTILHFVHHLV